jgi:hypothetical protein
MPLELLQWSVLVWVRWDFTWDLQVLHNLMPKRILFVWVWGNIKWQLSFLRNNVP